MFLNSLIHPTYWVQLVCFWTHLYILHTGFSSFVSEIPYTSYSLGTLHSTYCSYLSELTYTSYLLGSARMFLNPLINPTYWVQLVYFWTHLYILDTRFSSHVSELTYTFYILGLVRLFLNSLIHPTYWVQLVFFLFFSRFLAFFLIFLLSDFPAPLFLIAGGVQPLQLFSYSVVEPNLLSRSNLESIYKLPLSYTWYDHSRGVCLAFLGNPQANL